MPRSFTKTTSAHDIKPNERPDIQPVGQEEKLAEKPASQNPVALQQLLAYRPAARFIDVKIGLGPY